MAGALVDELSSEEGALGTSSLTSLIRATQADPGAFFARQKLGDAVLDRLVATLNSDEAGNKQKVAALGVIANLALVDGQQDNVLDAVRHVSERFEKHLTDKETGAGQYGTALGPYHEMMVVILVRLCEYKFRAADFLEFLHDDVALSLRVLTQVLKVAAYEDDLTAALLSVLNGFAQPGTYIDSGGGGGGSDSKAVERPVEEHAVTEFCARADALLDEAIRASLVQAVATPLAPRLFGRITPKNPQPDVVSPLSAAQVATVVSTLSFVHNLYLFATHGTVAFRQHILASTTLVSSVLIPFVHSCANALGGDAGAAEATAVPARDLKRAAAAALKGLVLATFRMPRQAPAVRRINPSATLLGDGPAGDAMRASPALVALVLLLNVNLNAFEPERDSGAAGKNEPLPDELGAAALRATARRCIEAMSDKALGTVRAVVSRSDWLPVARDNGTFAAVWAMIGDGDDGEDGDGDADGDGDGDGAEAPPPAPTSAHGQAAVDARPSVRSPSWGADESGSSTATEIPTTDAPARTQEPPTASVVAEGKAAERAEAPQGAEAAATATPAVDVGASQTSLSDLPGLSSPSQAGRRTIDAPSAAAASTGSGGGAAPSSGGGDSAGAAAESGTADGGGGDALQLPATHKTKKDKKKRKKDKERKKHRRDKSVASTATSASSLTISSAAEAGGAAAEGAGADAAKGKAEPERAALNAPVEFSCAINGHTMKEPVKDGRKGPGAPVFERSTIEMWLDRSGSVCPISGDPLAKEDLVVDEVLKRRITEWHIQRAMALNASNNALGDDDDLYDF